MKLQVASANAFARALTHGVLTEVLQLERGK